jgi:two-component system, sensor histidine kinase
MTDSRSFQNSEPDEIQLRVLVVDDNALNRVLMEAMLTEFGCVVSLAENGEAGSGIARANPFDLIVMDLQMPVLDGDGATRRIRAEGASKQAFVVRWTTEDDTRLNRELYDGELPKPLTCSPLIAAVSLASRRALNRMDVSRGASWRAADVQPPRR